MYDVAFYGKLGRNVYDHTLVPCFGAVIFTAEKEFTCPLRDSIRNRLCTTVAKEAVSHLIEARHIDSKRVALAADFTSYEVPIDH